MPAWIFSIGSIEPMTPVDMTSACSGLAPIASAAQAAICRASASPWSPVQALATPELIATTRIESLGVPLAVDLHRRGAHQILGVHAGRHGGPIGDDERQIELRVVSLNAGVDAGGSETLGEAETHDGGGWMLEVGAGADPNSGFGHWGLVIGYLLQQGGCFVEAVHQVEVLDGCAGGAFDQIVDRADHHDAAADAADRDVAEVGAADLLRGRQRVRQPDERLVGVKILEHAEQRFLVELAGWLGVAGGEDAAVHRDEVGREDDAALRRSATSVSTWSISGMWRCVPTP